MAPPLHRLAVCYGTRPQVIKASRLVAALRTRWSVCTVDTGQHYDFHLNELLYRQLGVTPPDRFLDVGSGTHAEQTAAIITRAAEALVTIKPSMVVVIGDTNSTLGSALAAAQLRIPVVHVEAGLRARDRSMAEDMNRRVVDSVSAVLCAPSARAAAQLRAEQAGGAIWRTGDIAYDVLRQHQDTLAEPVSAADWPLEMGTEYVFSTLHRAELTHHAERLSGVLRGLGGLPLPVMVAAHPRLRRALDEYGLLTRLPPNLTLLEPLGYLDALRAVARAVAVVTDSGGLQREAYWLGTPCLTIRQETEWPETVESGANTLVAPDVAGDQLPEALATRLRGRGEAWVPDAYGDGDASSRICEAIASVCVSM